MIYIDIIWAANALLAVLKVSSAKLQQNPSAKPDIK